MHSTSCEADDEVFGENLTEWEGERGERGEKRDCDTVHCGKHCSDLKG